MASTERGGMLVTFKPETVRVAASSVTAPRGYDPRPTRNAIFILGGLDQRGLAAAAAGVTHYYMMMGTGSGSIRRYWVVTGDADFSASQYLGVDTPLTNVYVAAQWFV